ncbi:iron chelate uptake ABC transporter family permease subunit [Streptococcus anginosus]|nr:iron chelate uptake ABC transporter family permease subunit [Streptococcus anginosus]MED5870411.1 iron chelate uptake ABC transporter family permease subunit [Streptococcus anginosus]MED5899902.1 iron chelate uptake ABC transporter family permease subunit [Streptococcus anginosus]MED5909403.1 iron chelate uptake ABC transporter family permease subunit [Streptococcus anginosus]MED5969922.1 iron chelate uptake ABC transporter family permease subunit [Streptococcus anginosus]
MNKMKSQTRNRLLLLLLLASLSGLLYLMPMEYPLTGFIMKLRSQKLLTYLLVAIAGGLATISFQTITENRFLTPSILGMESLYVFMQTIYLFFASKFICNTGHPLLEFILVLLIQCGFFFCLQPALKKLLQQGFVFILLICMALGTLFRSASTFLQVLMDPNEYDKLQTKLFPSFQRINMDILSVAAIIIGLAGLYLLKKNAILNVFHLDKKTATILGVEVEKEQKKILWAIVLLTSTTTALVGPMMFFGFMMSNLAYLLIKEYQHKWLFSVAILLGFLSLTTGQMLVERVFQLQINVSMVIELVGGLFFFYLLAKEVKR